jgi:hypothetical protein
LRVGDRKIANQANGFGKGGASLFIRSIDLINIDALTG